MTQTLVPENSVSAVPPPDPSQALPTPTYPPWEPHLNDLIATWRLQGILPNMVILTDRRTKDEWQMEFGTPSGEKTVQYTRSSYKVWLAEIDSTRMRAKFLYNGKQEPKEHWISMYEEGR